MSFQGTSDSQSVNEVNNHNVDFNTSQKYISWCIGGSYENKKLSDKQIVYVCDKLNLPIVFIGGFNENDLAEKIITKSSLCL